MNAVITTQVFREWLHRLKDHKPVGEGVQELRVPVGPGYRVYYVQTGYAIYVLLVGGDKGSQKRDIATAKQMAAAIRREQ